MKQLFYKTQFKLIASFIAVSLLMGGLSIIVGGYLINNTLMEEAINRISYDLNVAREIYTHRGSMINNTLRITAMDRCFNDHISFWVFFPASIMSHWLFGPLD